MRFVGRMLGGALALALIACGAGDQLAAPAAPLAQFQDFGLQAPAVSPVTPLVQLVIPTYDGSGQAVHPDVLWFPSSWRGYEYWMAFTPYPGGQEAFENPSIVVSHDGVTWQVPPGLSNPVVRQPGKSAFNSDPDLSYDAATDQLVMLTREVRGGFNRVSTLSSKNGIAWTAPRLAFLRKNHGIISPTMVISPARDPRLWFVDAGARACPQRVTRVMRQEGTGRRPLDNPGPERGWGPSRLAGLVQAGYNIWHIDVAWVAALKEYWAVYPAYRSRTCGPRDLFFARSPDGVQWTTYPEPLLRHEDRQWTSAMLYRAATVYDAGRDVMRIYLSASAPGPDWRIGMVEFKYTALLAQLDGGAHLSSAARVQRAGPLLEERTLP